MAAQDRHNSNYEEKLQKQQLADKSKQGKSRRFLFVYSFIMFSVALALILLSYFVSNRNSAAITADSEHPAFSVSAMKSIESLQNDVAALREENSVLKERSGTQEIELQSLSEALDKQAEELSRLHDEAAAFANKDEALELLWQIYKLFAQNKYGACREAIAYMNESGLYEFLPEECITSFQSESPKSEFDRISKAVG